jgi:hypothetical protein
MRGASGGISSVGARLRVPRSGRHAGTRAARGSVWRALRPSRQELADGFDRKRSRQKARPGIEKSAAKRREARRPASLAGHLWRSKDGPDREAGHRVRAAHRTRACRRFAPLTGERDQPPGARAPDMENYWENDWPMALIRNSSPASSARSQEDEDMAAPTAEETVTPEMIRAERRGMWKYTRPLSNALGLFHLCRRPACCKARRCRGDPNDCLDLRSDLVPDLAHRWAVWLTDAVRRGQSLDALTQTRPAELVSYESWIAGLHAASKARR